MKPPARLIVLPLLVGAFAGCMGGGGVQSTPPGDDPLVASFTFSPEIPAVGDPVQFSDTSSGGPTSWSWEFGDGATSAEASPSHAFGREEVFAVSLTVADATGQADTAAVFVSVGSMGGGTPTPDQFRVDFTYTVLGRVVDFEPRVFPGNASVEDYFWEFGDGEVGRDSAPQHTYDADGLYEVKVRARSGTSLSEAKHAVAVGVDASVDPTAFATRPFAVIAVVDTGINPYHEEFLAPEFTVHPSTFITGYPADSIELSLTLDAQSYQEAVAEDGPTWSSVRTGKLYWIPGTRIIGAYSAGKDGATAILDNGHPSGSREIGHGTMVASDAAGASIGTCPTCLIVVVEAGDPVASYATGLSWALQQPWIDVVTNSWNYCLAVCDVDTGYTPPGFPSADTRSAVEAGKAVLFASGNGMANGFDVPTLTYWNQFTGPDWMITVGAADAATGATILGTGRPVDVTAFGLDWKGAAHKSLTQIEEFSGTSAATPIVAGAFGSLVLRARESFGDFEEGPRKGTVAAGENLKGSLSDGKLTRAEAERALYLTARGATGSGPIYPVGLPHSAAAFLYAGYGLVDKKTSDEAFAVISGAKTAPSRPNEDQWAMVDSTIRKQIHGSWNPGLDYAAEGPTDDDVAAWASALDVLLDPAT
ncbi:MAG TPA: PKD domain-containing protein [Candidatus Thermoplasmatota archaeon]|nr:PKD domain-containing protein [Candidatus Thermoplasmatota archaeon]